MDGLTDGGMNMELDGKMIGWMDGWVKLVDGWSYVLVDGEKEERMERLMRVDGKMSVGRWVDGWRNG